MPRMWLFDDSYSRRVWSDINCRNFQNLQAKIFKNLSALAMCVSKFLGCHAGPFFERTVEGTVIGKPHELCKFSGVIIVAQ